MKVDVVLGLQWGDEGKGKIVDVLANSYPVIARFQGGPNAGHSLHFEGKKFVLHTVPSGVFRKNATNIIGNGDVDSGPKAKQMFDTYGVDGVMIGRATYGRPWIFREVKHFLETGEVMPQPSVVERVAIAKEHLAKSLEIKGEKVGILEMRRHLSNYFKGLPDFKSTRLQLVTLNDVEELYATLDMIAQRWGDVDMSGAVPPSLSHEI